MRANKAGVSTGLINMEKYKHITIPKEVSKNFIKTGGNINE